MPLSALQHVAVNHGRTIGNMAPLLVARERQLSAVFASLVEEATLASRMRNNLTHREDDTVAHHLSSRISLLEQEATKVAEWLHSMTGLIEPRQRAQ
jgi:hypothetical protein